MGSINTILITGITGYLGSNLATSFLRNGFDVIGIVRDSSDLKRLSLILDKIKIYTCTDSQTFEKAFIENHVDLIIHTATSYGRKNELLSDLIAANISFPSMILQLSIKYKVPYFINTDTSLPARVNLYSLTKSQFSSILKWHSELSTIINVKLEYFFGPGDQNNKFVTLIIKDLLSNKKEIELSEGTQIRDFIYIDDVSDAYLQIIKNVEQFSGFIDIPLGLGEGISLKRLVEKLKSISGNTDVKLGFGKIPMRQSEVTESIANVSIIKSLGWVPQFTLEQGLYKTFNIEKHDVNK